MAEGYGVGMSNKTEIDALREEIAALRRELAQLRQERVIHHWHHQPPQYIAPPSPYAPGGYPPYPGWVAPTTCIAREGWDDIESWGGGTPRGDGGGAC
jgi:hypothetical protein